MKEYIKAVSMEELSNKIDDMDDDIDLVVWLQKEEGSDGT